MPDFNQISSNDSRHDIFWKHDMTVTSVSGEEIITFLIGCSLAIYLRYANILVSALSWLLLNSKTAEPCCVIFIVEPSISAKCIT